MSALSAGIDDKLDEISFQM